MTKGKVVTIVNETNIQSMKNTVEVLMREWIKRNLAVEIASMEGNRTIVDPAGRKVRDYAISTHNRRRFCLYNIRAFYDNESISYKQLIQLLNISRNALDTMIDECVGSEWIKMIEFPAKNDCQFIAADILVNSYEGYANWLWQEWENTGTFKQSQSIIEIRDILAHAKCKNVK